MRRGVTTCGVLSKRELKILPGLPSEERLKKGPVAVIECNQEIPCNPCVAACPREAIKVKALTSLPELDEDRCNGCGSCIAPCPGLAIFVVDMSYSEREAVVMLPYEFLPYPKVGERGNDRPYSDLGLNSNGFCCRNPSYFFEAEFKRV